MPGMETPGPQEPSPLGPKQPNFPMQPKIHTLRVPGNIKNDPSRKPRENLAQANVRHRRVKKELESTISM